MYVDEFLVELGFDKKIRGSMAGIMIGEALGLPYEHHNKLPDGEVPEMIASTDYDDPDVEIRGAGECSLAAETSLMTLFGEGNVDTVATWLMQWRTWDHTEGSINTKKVLFDALELKVEEGLSASGSAWRASTAYSEAHPRDSDDDALMRAAAIFPYIDFKYPEEVWNTVDEYVKLTHNSEDVTLTCVMWIGLLFSAHRVQANVTLDDALKFVPDALKDKAVEIIDPIRINCNVTKFLSPLGWTVSTFQSAAAALFSCLPQFASEEITDDLFLNKVFFESIRYGANASKVASLSGSLAGMLVGIESFDEEQLKTVHAFVPVEDGYNFLTKAEWSFSS